MHSIDLTVYIWVVSYLTIMMGLHYMKVKVVVYMRAGQRSYVELLRGRRESLGTHEARRIAPEGGGSINRQHTD